MKIVPTISECDVVIAVGGDGTILHVAKKAAIEGKPILGINFGRVGFISSIENNEIELLRNLTEGKYSIEKRSMLNVSINMKTFLSLNDVVISKGSMSKIIDIEVSSNQKIISKYRADGIIVSTPTGSTAYALSAGGAIIDPQLSCMMVTPVCPHMNFSRPTVFGNDKKLEIKTFFRNNDEVFLSIDGENTLSINKEDTLSVCVSNLQTKFIKLKDKLFIEKFNEKLKLASESL